MSAPTIREIAERVATEHGLTLAVVLGRSKVIPIARARQEAMHACWAEHRWSLTRIGTVFKRHHTTVLHAARKIEAEPKPLDLDTAA